MFQKPKAPPPPAAPTVMPTADSPGIRRARKRRLARDVSRSGRLSTMLSETLGG